MRENLTKAFDKTGAFVLDVLCAYLLLFSLLFRFLQFPIFFIYRYYPVVSSTYR